MPDLWLSLHVNNIRKVFYQELKLLFVSPKQTWRVSGRRIYKRFSSLLLIWIAWLLCCIMQQGPSDLAVGLPRSNKTA